MEISEARVRQIIIEVLRRLGVGGGESASPAVPSRQEVYVVCPAEKEEACLRFLRACKEAHEPLAFTAVLEDANGAIRERIRDEGLCEGVVSADRMDREQIVTTVYPAFSRSALCEAGLGMDRLFEARILRHDFEAGRSVYVMTDGLAPFTGKEPPAYKEMILSYIRSLLKMGVRFVRDAGEIAGTADGKAAERASVQSAASVKQTETRPALSGPQESTAVQIALPTQGNLVTASDMKRVPKGGTVLLTAQNVITPMAKDIIRDRNITVKRA